MTGVIGSALRPLRVAPLFTVYVLATLGVATIIGLVTIDVIDLGMTHFGEASHRTHDVTFGLLFATIVVGLIAQLRRHDDNAAGMAMTLAPVAALLLAAAISGAVDAVLVRNPLGRYAAPVLAVAVLLHPSWRAFFRSFSRSKISWTMVTLVGVAAVPLTTSAVDALDLQRTVADPHTMMGHYGFMAALSFTIVATGLLASLRPIGWRPPAWVTGALPAVLGVTSLLYPDSSSSLERPWALAAIGWGALFVVTAELRQGKGDRDRSAKAARRQDTVG